MKLEIKLYNRTTGEVVLREVELDIDAYDAYAWDLAHVALKGPMGPKGGVILYDDPSIDLSACADGPDGAGRRS